MPHLTTGQAIAQALIDNGVDTLFGIPGAHMYDFIDAVYGHREQLRFVTARHEQGAGYMAFGYAKATGRVGAYTVVPGPGLLNSSAAICTAYGATTPLLCITGNIMADLIGKGRGQLHELPDQLITLRSICKWAERIDAPEQAGTVMHEAFRQCLGGRQRPVAVEAPWDVFGQAGDVTMPGSASIEAPPEPDRKAVSAAAALIAAADNPLIIVGAGATEAGAEILELAEILQAPVTTHRSGKGIVSDHSPYSLSSTAAHELWPAVDLVIGIGSRLELVHFRWRWQPPGLKTVRIDIDAEELTRVPSDVALNTDAARGVRALLDELSVPQRTSRAAEFEQATAAARQKLQRIQPQYDYLQAIRRALPEDGYFVEEICQAGFTARMCFDVYAPRQYVTCGYQETLGFGFNTALGVKVAHPDKPVVCISGDGGFMFGVQELATAVQHGINLVTVVFNNRAYGNVRRDQETRYNGRYIGSDLDNPDFVALAQSFGAVGLQVTDAQGLQQAVSNALAMQAPVVIEVPLPTGSEQSPWPLVMPPPPTA